MVITDACGAGPGDLVIVAGGSAARIPVETGGVPTDATAVAFVDQLSVGARDVDIFPPEPSDPATPPSRTNRQRRK